MTKQIQGREVKQKSPKVWTDCMGGCGRKVLRQAGECRKCRRKRIHAGLKVIKKLEGRKDGGLDTTGSGGESATD